MHVRPQIFAGRRVLGLNEQLKFLRYHEGQYFAPHFDGAFARCACSPGKGGASRAPTGNLQPRDRLEIDCTGSSLRIAGAARAVHDRPGTKNRSCITLQLYLSDSVRRGRCPSLKHTPLQSAVLKRSLAVEKFEAVVLYQGTKVLLWLCQGTRVLEFYTRILHGYDAGSA